jgi:hypothetical protein
MARAFLLAGLALLVMAPEALAIYLQPRLQGLTSPVLVTHAGDGTNRLFVVELPGVIKVVAGSSASPSVFLDISDRVLDGGERGLLGLAFHPQFASNDRLFVHYTREPDGASVIAEYLAAGTPAATQATERVLLVVDQPFANHNGGSIAFGPDGHLYIGLGDGGSSNDPQNRAQNIDDLLGKILRIRVDGAEPYEVPSDNPYAGSTPGRDEIYAIGLRNPFRFSFDRTTGALLVGDVGQGHREEIDLVSIGANLGWRVYEGTRCTGLGPSCSTAGLTPPIVEYDHSLGRCSVTGGYAYRGSRGTLPAGTYVFADFCSGEIFAWWNGVMHVLLDTTLNVSSFGEDEAGELYVVGLGGTVHAITSARFAPSASRLPDLDGNGTADIVWRNAPTGAYAFWLMANGALSSASVFGVPDEWTVTATGDVNGDARSDLVWRSGITGLTAIWLMQGHTRVGASVVGVGPGWDLVGTGDVNGDSRDDLLWRNVDSGSFLFWLMQGTSIGSVAAISAGPEWQLAGVGDYSGDGTDDLVMRHMTDGRLSLWVLVQGRLQSTTVFNVSPGWNVAGTQDVSGDSDADIVWRHGVTGSFGVWTMAGTAIQQTATFGASPSWTVSSTGDLNGDGRADVFWRHPASGLLAFWFLDATTISGSSVFSVGSGWEPVESP